MSNGPNWITPSADDLAALTPSEDVVESAAPEAGMSTRTKIGVLATAVVVGAVGVMTLQGSSSASPTAGSAPGAPPGSQQQGSGGRGGFGSPGTVTSISPSSITVTTSSGTITAAITSATQVIVNGQQGSVSDISKGATVMVHTEGDVAERIFVGTTGFGGGGPGFGPPPGQQQGTAPANGTTSTT
jgi:hypothetical protein